MGDALKPYPSYPELSMSSTDTTYNKTGEWRVMRPAVDAARCSRCGVCWKFCPDVAIALIDGLPHINYDYCKGCGVCAEECPRKCIRFEFEER
jgi:2-oxoacid:acceptor oxidoreductase delta subunit (pyruvate/2-ketoisovalerate family)